VAPLARGGIASPLARDQYAALVWMQTRIFVNSLRTMRGSFELGARILTGFLFFIFAIGPAVGMGFGAWAGVAHGRRLALAVLLWVVCGVWQFFSVLAPALAGQNPDLSHLLRFPVSFGSWIVLYLAHGIVAPSTLIGLLWILGIGIGITVARPGLWLATAVTLTVFALFNLLLSRAILAWVERWMAQRRTREIVTGILLFLGLGAQAFNPAIHHYHRMLPGTPAHARQLRISRRVWSIQAVFPPGLATDSIAEPMQHRGSGAFPLAGLGLCTLAVGGLLALRLRSESRGESLSEAPRRLAPGKPRGRAVLDLAGPVGAVFEKDLRYLLRSGPMLYALAAPLVLVFLFGSAFRAGNMAGLRAAYALPLGIVWGFTGLTRLANNSLGGEGAGLSFYYLSPTPLRVVILGKNALHGLLFGMEAILISGLVFYRFGVPQASLGVATAAWLLFAVPANFAVGNTLSITMPYRMSMTRLRNESGALGNGLLSTLIQAATLGVGALVFVPCAAFGHPWLATPVLLVLAAAAVFAYLRVLANVDRMMRSHGESLLLEIAKTGHTG